MEGKVGDGGPSGPYRLSTNEVKEKADSSFRTALLLSGLIAEVISDSLIA